MLSLTDMWKAQGAPEHKRPDDWKKDAGHREFMDHVALMLNTPTKGIWKGRRGANGGTMAHWQIALAYAKYLSPEFHMWCNQVVRERMEGRKIATTGVTPEIAEMIERGFGIQRMLANKVTGIERVLESLTAMDRTSVQAREFVTCKEVMEEFGFEKGEMRGRAVHVTTRLRRFSVEHQNPLRFTTETKRYLFRVDAVQAWLRSGGQAYLADMLVSARVKAGKQPSLKLVQ